MQFLFGFLVRTLVRTTKKSTTLEGLGRAQGFGPRVFHLRVGRFGPRLRPSLSFEGVILGVYWDNGKENGN